ncbi:ABC transporter ATP-binding protein [Myxococcota bacterium]|nr:ABC transporter ATP-binding protein [Myxococcota bacterium]MBU1432472.1 ABC transporter ATP-binding protein [Myxococcota bacterium]MBU1900406.1 ABC transporter ATP-binding protein [Myxococcota bacterium]
MSAPRLTVEGLQVGFGDGASRQRIIDGLDLRIEDGEAVALVGESGCGKSLTARAIAGLLPPHAWTEGRVVLGGLDLNTLPPARLRALRGEEIGFIFQDPISALNPLFTVGEQIAERLRWHGGLGRRAAWARAVALMEEVGIPDAAARARVYPHQLSGGMRQRIVIAIAIACDPSLLIADEPTTALDVTTQAQIMALIAASQRARRMALLLITHDLALVAQAVDRVLVMYAGQIVEALDVEALYGESGAGAKHPYTRALLCASPSGVPGAPLKGIPGAVVTPARYPVGCRFADRCRWADDDCRRAPIPLVDGVRCEAPDGGAPC